MILINIKSGALLGIAPHSLSAVVVASAIVCATNSGCGSGDSDTAPVRGQVTLDGEPVASARIVFYPEHGRSAMSNVVDGQYSLRTFVDNDGALLGNHVVTVTAMEVKRRKPVNIQPPANATPGQLEDLRREMEELAITQTTWLVPERYSERKTSPLTAEVTSGDNIIDFQLDSAPQ